MRTNGTLKQLKYRSDTPWIGWGIIGLLLTLVSFFGAGWLKNTDLKIAETQRDIKNIQLTMQTEKARTDTLSVQIATLIGSFDRISDSLRSIDNRLTKMEVTDTVQRERRQNAK